MLKAMVRKRVATSINMWQFEGDRFMHRMYSDISIFHNGLQNWFCKLKMNSSYAWIHYSLLNNRMSRFQEVLRNNSLEFLIKHTEEILPSSILFRLKCKQLSWICDCLHFQFAYEINFSSTVTLLFIKYTFLFVPKEKKN